MIVKDMSVSLLYGEDINTNGIMENNENDAELTYPFDNADGSLDKGWYPFLTCFSYEKNTDGQGESRVNINSANKQAMQETFGDALEERDIDNIIQQRDNTQFQSIEIGFASFNSQFSERHVDRVLILSIENGQVCIPVDLIDVGNYLQGYGGAYDAEGTLENAYVSNDDRSAIGGKEILYCKLCNDFRSYSSTVAD